PQDGHHDGPVLTALGLEAADPAGAVRRAESLLAPVLPRRPATGEVLPTAVVTPDGTELFFCRTAPTDGPSWTDDFAPAPMRTAPPVGIGRIDHIALTQPWHHFDEAALFYRSVLGLRPDDSLDLADPYGLFRSRAMSGDDGALRIALAVAPGPSDPGVPLQHVAFATDDAIATARLVRDRGARLLPVPASYYDDLYARYDLDPDELAELRELGILYDRDEQGEFRHFYTVAVGRVFFEVVQRGEGYRGYGAPNATVRLAAQHLGAAG
ncbi:VOC family protein, partial [Streptomyces sp. T-3]|nr:VOC family protein [Streptomyces sp. T-3]